MNKLYNLLICVFTVSLYASMELVDEIKVVIYHEMGTVAVLASDIRPALDGHMLTLREVVLNKLMELDALYHKIIVTSEQAEQYIESIQKSNRLSRKAVEDLFTQAGYTYAEALEFLRSKQMIEQVIEFRVKSDKRMIVSRAQAEERYRENPPIVEPLYLLDIAFIPTAQLKDKSLDAYIATINLDTDLVFDEPFELKESEIVEDRKIITTKKAGGIVFTEPVDGGFEVTRLIRKTEQSVVPFDDCFMDIATQIRQEKLKEVFESYYEILLEQATFRFTHPEDEKILESKEMI